MLKVYDNHRMNMNRITSKGASLLFNSLRESRSRIMWINMSKNELDDTCIHDIGHYVMNNASIERLDVGNLITDRGVEILIQYLLKGSRLKKLDLSSNKSITNQSIPIMMKMIDATSVEDIDVKFTQVTNMNALVVVIAMKLLRNTSSMIDIGRRLVVVVAFL